MPAKKGNELAEISQLNDAQIALLNQETPKEFIKKRKGRGGMMFDYVEIGYVIDQLNKLFGFNWDFEVTDKQIGKLQVFIEGRLTCRTLSGQQIVKTQYGGSDIKKDKQGNVLGIADDLKAASSDALKKCASLIGVAGDVYWPDKPENGFEAATEALEGKVINGFSGAGERLTEKKEKAEATRSQWEDGTVTEKQLFKIDELRDSLRWTPDIVIEVIEEKFKKPLPAVLTKGEASDLISYLADELKNKREEQVDINF